MSEVAAAAAAVLDPRPSIHPSYCNIWLTTYHQDRSINSFTLSLSLDSPFEHQPLPKHVSFSRGSFQTLLFAQVLPRTPEVQSTYQLPFLYRSEKDQPTTYILKLLSSSHRKQTNVSLHTRDRTPLLVHPRRLRQHSRP